MSSDKKTDEILKKYVQILQAINDSIPEEEKELMRLEHLSGDYKNNDERI